MVGKVKEIKFMNRNEVEQAIKEFPVAVLPLGATEQHGPQLPLGTDTFLAESISKSVCEISGAILLPSMPFGYSWVWRNISGTVSLDEDHVETIIKDVAHSVSRYGVKLLVVIGGHDANNSAMKYAARELEDEINLKVIYLFYPEMQEVMKKLCESDTWYGMVHACEFETSLMLAVRPDLVDMSKAVKEYPSKPNLYEKSTISIGDLSKSGVYGDPTLATKEKGEAMLNIFIKNMSSLLVEAYGTLNKL